MLGWTEVDATPERIDDSGGDDAVRERVTGWLAEERSLLAAVRSQVLPEADVVLLNPAHPDAADRPAPRDAAVQLRSLPPPAADARALRRRGRRAGR